MKKMFPSPVIKINQHCYFSGWANSNKVWLIKKLQSKIKKKNERKKSGGKHESTQDKHDRWPINHYKPHPVWTQGKNESWNQKLNLFPLFWMKRRAL